MDKKEILKARGMSGWAIQSGKIIPDKICNKCGKEKKTEGHHNDYSKPLELEWLCRSCHMIKDGRMKIIHIKPKGIPKPCIICGKKNGRRRKGRCHSCSEYYMRRGIERPYIIDGRIEKGKAARDANCLRCGRKADVVGNPMRGYCVSCYTILWRKKELPFQSQNNFTPDGQIDIHDSQR